MKELTDQHWMRRCFDLARMGAGRVSPNPMVGAVLVFQNRIIGEGFHAQYGGPHAEVHAVASVAPSHQKYIPLSTLYVSLEPCCVYGKTPPCTNLIIEQKIPKVVISCIDPSPGVNGAGIRLLEESGVEVISGILEEEGKALIAARSVYAIQKRPYIILKWAETQNGFAATLSGQPFWISSAASRRLTHRWRMEADAILVGTATALHDNPRLDTRFYYGKSPKRIVLDRHLTLPHSLHLFDGKQSTLIVHQRGTSAQAPKNAQLLETEAEGGLDVLLEALYNQNISILLVEGGPKVLQSFIEQDLWDEARVITGESAFLPQGVRSPALPFPPVLTSRLGSDTLRMYDRNVHNR